MSIFLRPARNGKGFQYDIRFRWPDGTTFRERKDCPVHSKSGALRWAQAREASLLAAGPQASQPAADVPTLRDFWPRVVRDHYQANRKKPSTINAAQSIYRLHLAPAFDTKRLTLITSADVAALKGRLAENAPKTVNNVLSVLSKVLNCAVKWGVLTARPCEIELLHTAPPVMEWYEVEDYRRLVAGARKAGAGHLLLVLLAGSAGLRVGEIMALKWDDLDLKRGLINVDRAIWQGHEETPKGGRGRKVPMTGELREALKAHRHLMGERVLYSAGREITTNTAHSWIETAQRRAGLPVNGKVHMLRHTFCSHLAAAGVPAKAIQELAGHTDLSTTLKYMHLAPGDRDGAIEKLASYHASEETRGKERAG